MSTQLQMFETGGALLSPCGRYRYTLTRLWDLDRPVLGFVMLNPSTADASVSDPTIRRCIGFARAWDYGGLEVGNLFALRSTEPAALLTADDPIGPDNDSALCTLAMETATLVVAWGAHPAARERAEAALQLIGCEVYCLGTTKDGYPRHPLYVPKGTPLTLYRRTGRREAR